MDVVDGLALRPFRQLPQSEPLKLTNLKLCSTWTNGLFVLTHPNGASKALRSPCFLYEWDATFSRMSEVLHDGPCLSSVHEGKIDWDGAGTIFPYDQHRQTYVVLCTLYDRPVDELQPFFADHFMQLACFSLTGGVAWSTEFLPRGWCSQVFPLTHGFIAVHFSHSSKLVLVDGATGNMSLPPVALGCSPVNMNFGDDGLLYAHLRFMQVAVFRLDVSSCGAKVLAVTATLIRSVQLQIDHPLDRPWGLGDYRLCFLSTGMPVVRVNWSSNLYFLNKDTGQVAQTLDTVDPVPLVLLDRLGRLIIVATALPAFHVYVYLP